MVIDDRELVYFEKKYFPQAVLDYTKVRGSSKTGGRMKGDSDLVSRVKMHLASAGWIFYYQKKKGDKKELRYENPNGRKFYSLMTACEWYVSNGYIQINRDAKDSVSPVQNRSSVADDEDEIQGCRKQAKKERKAEKNEKNGLILRIKMKSSVYDDEDEDEIQAQGFPDKTKKRNYVEDDVSVFLQPARKRPRKGAPSMLSKLIDRNLVLPGATVHYRNKNDGLPMKHGTISREGVLCRCCGEVFSLTRFEAHAGSTNHNPSVHMFLEDGRSIHECLNSQKRVESYQGTEPESDYICSVCRNDGDLLLCDQCPSAFHTKCLGLNKVPQGDWFCPSCCCRICNLVSVKDSYLQCGQCEHRYHIRCLRSRGHILLEYHPEGSWFCNSSCKSIHLGLQNLLGKPNQVGYDNLTWTWLKCKHSNAPDNGKLRVALDILKECFKPVIEPRNGRDVLKDAIFNNFSDLQRLNFEGFYTMALGRKDNVFTVALIRIHGEKVAEIPFVGTRFEYQKLGMCRTLMNELEKKLRELGVERLVLPASPDVVETWENKFGFSRMNESEKLNFHGCIFLDFPGTIMCQKIFKNIPFLDFDEEEIISI